MSFCHFTLEKYSNYLEYTTIIKSVYLLSIVGFEVCLFIILLSY